MNKPKTAIRIKGQDGVKIDCNNNPKESFTAGLTISAGGRPKVTLRVLF